MPVFISRHDYLRKSLTACNVFKREIVVNIIMYLFTVILSLGILYTSFTSINLVPPLKAIDISELSFNWSVYPYPKANTTHINVL